MTKQFFCQGTLGDTYIIVCKLLRIKADKIKIYHKTIHKHWHPQIKEIYSLLSNVEVEFIDIKRTDLEEITSNCHKQEFMEFFPKWYIPNRYNLDFPYTIIQPHAGKDRGGNCKELSIELIEALVGSVGRVVLLGTKEKYKDIKKCVNLVGKTSIKNAMSAISGAKMFIGPEGLLSFISLSQRVPSIVYYTSEKAVEKRIVGTLWGRYCKELIRI